MYVASKCAGQLRLAPIGGVSGLDFAAAFACGRALGYDLVALAELLAIVVGASPGQEEPAFPPRLISND